MAELFYGPWHVAVTHVDVFPHFNFIVSDAVEGNGRHPVEEGYELKLNGSPWSIALEVLDFEEEVWLPAEQVRRDTKFTPLKGLAVVLDTRPKPPTTGWFGPLWLGVAITCTSEDPKLNTVPKEDLPDFTLPGE